MDMQPKARQHRKGGVAKVYWPNCSVCQFMKKNKDFRFRIMQSTYFNPQGNETMMDVVHTWGDPFGSSIMYAHFKRHQAKDLIRAASRFDDKGNLMIDKRMKPTVEVIEHIDPKATTNYELGLDEFIQSGRDKLARGEMQVSASTFVAAIKTKSDIDKNTKDRRLDMIKAFFVDNGQNQDAEPGGQTPAS